MRVKRKVDSLFLNAQTTLEYVIVIVLVVIALLASQVYIKRAIQGRWKGSADNIGSQYDYYSTLVDSRSKIESNTITNTTVVGSPSGVGWLERAEESNTVENKQVLERIVD